MPHANPFVAQEGTRTPHNLHLSLTWRSGGQALFDPLQECPPRTYGTPTVHLRLDLRYSVPGHSSQWVGPREVGHPITTYLLGCFAQEVL